MNSRTRMAHVSIRRSRASSRCRRGNMQVQRVVGRDECRRCSPGELSLVGSLQDKHSLKAGNSGGRTPQGPGSLGIGYVEVLTRQCRYRRGRNDGTTQCCRCEAQRRTFLARNTYASVGCVERREGAGADGSQMHQMPESQNRMYPASLVNETRGLRGRRECWLPLAAAVFVVSALARAAAPWAGYGLSYVRDSCTSYLAFSYSFCISGS
jgi:hypothetical protein